MNADDPPRARRLLAAICVAGVLLRAGTALAWPNVAAPDETFQYLEQAYRLLTGHGLVPWEYGVGARSWILPALLVPPLKVGLMVSADPAARLFAVSLFMALLSSVGTLSAYALGRRAGDVRHGLVAALLAACWPELVYFSPHPLADTIAALPLVAALALVDRRDRPSPRSLLAAGLLFGFAFIARIQLGPAIAVVLAALCVPAPRTRTPPLALGFGATLALYGVVDWITWGAPFKSILVYVAVNLGGVADLFGTEPPVYYLAVETREIWLAAAPLVLASAVIGARKLPLSAITVVLVLATFSLVGHKELRFIYPALPPLFVLCAVGSIEFADAVAARLRVGSPRAFGTATLVSLVWIAAALLVAAGPAMHALFHRDAAALAALRLVNADPRVCGVALDPAEIWAKTGRVRLRESVALYDGEPGQPTGAFNTLLVAADEPDVSRPAPQRGAFHEVACFGTLPWVCVFERPGPCDPAQGKPLVADPGASLDALLSRLGIPRRR